MASKDLEFWENLIKDNARPNCKIVLVGTKSEGRVLPNREG